MTLQETLSQADFAKRIGVGRSRVTALKQAGRLVMTEDGKRVLVSASIARIEATADPSKGEGESIPDERPDYQAARARREAANAQLAEIELMERCGALMQAQEVGAAVADAGVSFRMALEGMGAMLAPQLAGMTDESDIRQLVDEYVEHLLQELSHKLDQAGRGAA